MKKAQSQIQEAKRNASFVCKRADLLNALKAIKGARIQPFTLTTVSSTRLLVMNTAVSLWNNTLFLKEDE